jgi:hypothetical protein
MSLTDTFDQRQAKPPADPGERAPGYLLEDFGYLDEEKMAAALGITTQTLQGYRKNGKGPPHAVVARRVIYGIAGARDWLAAGGVHGEAE